MTKRFGRYLLAASMLAFAGQAEAQTVTFGTGGNGELTGSKTEAGVTYKTATGSLFMNSYGKPGNDLEGTAMDGGGVASFTIGGSLFTFAGLDFAAYNESGTGQQTLVVNGFRNGVQVGSTSYTLASTSNYYPTFANWTTEAAGSLTGINLDNLQVVLNASTDPTFNFAAIDNVRFGAAVASATPEPGTWALMIAGFGLAGVALRRRARGADAGRQGTTALA